MAPLFSVVVLVQKKAAYMILTRSLWALFLGLVAGFDMASAQMSGSRGGVTTGASSVGLAKLSAQESQSVITIDGTAVLRLEPSRIRIVLALTTEAVSSSECHEKMDQQLQSLRSQWKTVGIKDDQIVEDFISVLPRYSFEMKDVNNRQVAIEQKVGYLMQTNLHVSVADDVEAMKALRTAFAANVTDIIAFDYWSDALDAKKKEALSQATKAAKEKADLLLSVLAKRPQVINVQEQTTVHYPESMYESFENSHSAQYSQSYLSRHDIPRILLPRPQNTYYRGFLPNADVQPKSLAMKTELAIVSTVRIHYQSPAAEAFNASRE